MILQALVDLYQQLSAQGKIAPAGWAPVKVSYAIYLKEDRSNRLHENPTAQREKDGFSPSGTDLARYHQEH